MMSFKVKLLINHMETYSHDILKFVYKTNVLINVHSL